jgi:hypothetical protein
LHDLLAALKKAKVWQAERIRKILPAFSLEDPENQGEQVFA